MKQTSNPTVQNEDVNNNNNNNINNTTNFDQNNNNNNPNSSDNPNNNDNSTPHSNSMPLDSPSPSTNIMRSVEESLHEASMLSSELIQQQPFSNIQLSNLENNNNQHQLMNIETSTEPINHLPQTPVNHPTQTPPTKQFPNGTPMPTNTKTNNKPTANWFTALKDTQNGNSKLKSKKSRSKTGKFRFHNCECKTKTCKNIITDENPFESDRCPFHRCPSCKKRVITAKGICKHESDEVTELCEIFAFVGLALGINASDPLELINSSVLKRLSEIEELESLWSLSRLWRAVNDKTEDWIGSSLNKLKNQSVEFCNPHTKLNNFPVGEAAIEVLEFYGFLNPMPNRTIDFTKLLGADELNKFAIKNKLLIKSISPYSIKCRSSNDIDSIEIKNLENAEMEAAKSINVKTSNDDINLTTDRPSSIQSNANIEPIGNSNESFGDFNEPFGKSDIVSSGIVSSSHSMNDNNVFNNDSNNSGNFEFKIDPNKDLFDFNSGKISEIILNADGNTTGLPNSRHDSFDADTGLSNFNFLPNNLDRNNTMEPESESKLSTLSFDRNNTMESESTNDCNINSLDVNSGNNNNMSNGTKMNSNQGIKPNLNSDNSEIPVNGKIIGDFTQDLNVSREISNLQAIVASRNKAIRDLLGSSEKLKSGIETMKKIKLINEESIATLRAERSYLNTKCNKIYSENAIYRSTITEHKREIETLSHNIHQFKASQKIYENNVKNRITSKFNEQMNQFQAEYDKLAVQCKNHLATIELTKNQQINNSSTNLAVKNAYDNHITELMTKLNQLQGKIDNDNTTQLNMVNVNKNRSNAYENQISQLFNKLNDSNTTLVNLRNEQSSHIKKVMDVNQQLNVRLNLANRHFQELNAKYEVSRNVVAMSINDMKKFDRFNESICAMRSSDRNEERSNVLYLLKTLADVSNTTSTLNDSSQNRLKRSFNDINQVIVPSFTNPLSQLPPPINGSVNELEFGEPRPKKRRIMNNLSSNLNLHQAPFPTNQLHTSNTMQIFGQPPTMFDHNAPSTLASVPSPSLNQQYGMFGNNHGSNVKFDLNGITQNAIEIKTEAIRNFSSITQPTHLSIMNGSTNEQLPRFVSKSVLHDDTNFNNTSMNFNPSTSPQTISNHHNSLLEVEKSLQELEAIKKQMLDNDPHKQANLIQSNIGRVETNSNAHQARIKDDSKDCFNQSNIPNKELINKTKPKKAPVSINLPACLSKILETFVSGTKIKMPLTLSSDNWREIETLMEETNATVAVFMEHPPKFACDMLSLITSLGGCRDDVKYHFNQVIHQTNGTEWFHWNIRTQFVGQLELNQKKSYNTTMMKCLQNNKKRCNISALLWDKFEFFDREQCNAMNRVQAHILLNVRNNNLSDVWISECDFDFYELEKNIFSEFYLCADNLGNSTHNSKFENEFSQQSKVNGKTNSLSFTTNKWKQANSSDSNIQNSQNQNQNQNLNNNNPNFQNQNQRQNTISSNSNDQSRNQNVNSNINNPNHQNQLIQVQSQYSNNINNSNSNMHHINPERMKRLTTNSNSATITNDAIPNGSTQHLSNGQSYLRQANL